MTNLKEFWGIMNVLDSADDVALFVVSSRDQKILYCNHLVTVLTGAHTGSDIERVWDKEDFKKAVERCNEGGTYRYVVEQSTFGTRRNVTVGKVVWSQGVLAYSFLITTHADDEEEQERERIFTILGRSYRHIFTFDTMSGEVTTLLRPHEHSENGHLRGVYYHPVSFDEWRNSVISMIGQEDEKERLRSLLDPQVIMDNLRRGDYAFQFKRYSGSSNDWCELRFQRFDEIDGKVICTEKSLDEELNLNDDERKNEMILNSLSNIFRSIYLIDLKKGSFTTVKADGLLFGIPDEGSYGTLSDIVMELIPDDAQKKDFANVFSIKALSEAFGDGAENVAREYNNTLNDDMGWTGITAFKPPYSIGFEDKCVLTFLDITERKRVEAERNEKNIVVDVLSSRYIAVFFVKLKDGSFHSIAVPPRFRYIEKQFDHIAEAMKHYAKAYVLEQYRYIFKSGLPSVVEDGQIENGGKREYVFKSVEDSWIRINVFPVESKNGPEEVILAFEDFNDMMEQRRLNAIYNTTLLADYDMVMEYDPTDDQMFRLNYDGERIVREKPIGVGGLNSPDFEKNAVIHPDDLSLFVMACKKATVDESFEEGKTVSHMFLRRKNRETGEYSLFMYAFHYFEELGRRKVLITLRDAEREVL